MWSSFAVTSASRLIIAVVIVWLLIIFVITGPLMSWSRNRDDSGQSIDASNNGEMILARLSRAMNELTALKAQNEELRLLLQNYLPIDLQPKEKGIPSTSLETKELKSYPTQEYESTRRRLEFNVNELWSFLRAHTNTSTMQFANQIRHNMLYDLETIAKRDIDWRKSELKRLSDLVHNKLVELQNPSKELCGSAKKLVCQLNKGCGFGCQIHHLVYCMIVSMATKRTLIMNAHNWRYAHSKSSEAKGWDSVFLPLSQTCTDESGSNRVAWGSKRDLDDVQVVDLPIIDSMRWRPSYLPLTIPEEISSSLVTLHGAPIVWFIGQIVSYLMRPSSEMKDYIIQAKERFKFKSPIVGIHVRRTDKIGTEASFHPLSEYMKFVADYYDKLDLFNERLNLTKKVERLVYLATDDSSLWSKEIKPFQDEGYVFIGDSQISRTASIGRRYSIDSLRNIILDVWLLSESDVLVCTFSSQVCRLAYELMQTRTDKRPDRSNAFYSLDDIYYFGGQSDHNQIAILSHKARDDNEINFKVGDVIGIAGNHWNGFSKGVNRKTKQNGLYPGFKTIEKIESAQFAIFGHN